MKSEASRQPEYSKLAEIYDALMEDVDYEVWADFIDEIIQVHHPNPSTVLELACGTGSLALSLDELLCYDILATDKSPDMIDKARKKATGSNSVRFRSMNFLNIDLNKTFDVVVSIFDSINYLHEPNEILNLFDQVEKVLAGNGLFIFDFTTPKNSIQSINFLNNEEGYTENNFRFFRKSRYDPDAKIHYNDFSIEKLGNDRESVVNRYREVHKQRIYTLNEMLDIVGNSNFSIIAKYDGFDLIDADEDSLRITMVLACPKTQS